MKFQNRKINFSKKLFLSIGFFLIPLLSSLIPHFASAATLYTQSAQQDIFEGQTFVVSWYLDTEGVSINSVDLKINYSKDTLKAIDASAGNSLVSLWIKNPTIDSSQGTISLTGGIPNGASSSNVQIFRSTFEALASGPANISIDPNSVVLANNGQGTSIPLKFATVQFMIQPKNFIPNQITSSSHPDQNHWYKNNTVTINFSPKEKTDYSFSFSSNIDVIPDDKVAELQSVFNYPNMPDGVYYFKVNSKVGPSNWAEAGVYRVQIDGTPPEPFVPIISSDASVSGGAKFVSFSTVDKTSGISHYNIKVGLLGSNSETQSPYKLNKPLVGDSITVTAIDQAGNKQEAILPWPGLISKTLFEWILILIGLIAVGFTFLKYKK